MSSVKSYTDDELLKRVSSLDSFKKFPKGFWILGVRSKEDVPNTFDDKFYLFKGKEFIQVTSGTTNPGTPVLKSFSKYNKMGAAVVKSDEWFYNVWGYGLHKGKMPALRQKLSLKYYRDGNEDDKSEESGQVYVGNIGIDFHTVSYKTNLFFVKKFINGWSAGCQVANNTEEYYQILDKVKDQDTVTYCLIKEF